MSAEPIGIEAAERLLNNPTTELEKAVAWYINGTSYDNKPLLFKYVYNAMRVSNGEPILQVNDLPTDLKYSSKQGVMNLSAYIHHRCASLCELRAVCDNIGSQPAIVINITPSSLSRTSWTACMTPNIKWIMIGIDLNPAHIPGDCPAAVRMMFERKDEAISKQKSEEIFKTVLSDDDTNVFVIRDVMSYNIAHAAHDVFGPRQIYVISMHRTNIYEDSSKLSDPTYEQPFAGVSDIVWNTASNYNWLRIILPKMAMMRYRQPFYEDDPKKFEKFLEIPQIKQDFEMANSYVNGIGPIDYIDAVKKKRLPFFKGIMKPRFWCAVNTPEVMLETKCELVADYGDSNEYENKMFLYNCVYRCLSHMRNENAGIDVGLDHCNDCAGENAILTKWVSIYKDLPILANMMPRDVKAASMFLTRISSDQTTIKYFHGHFMKPRTSDDLKNIVKMYDIFQAERSEKNKLMWKLRTSGYTPAQLLGLKM